MNRSIVAFFGFISFFGLCGQSDVSLSYEGVSNFSYEIYEIPYLVKMIYRDTLEAKNRTPEELMSSVISATNQERIDYNTFGGVENSDKKEYLLARDCIACLLKLGTRLSRAPDQNRLYQIGPRPNSEADLLARDCIACLLKLGTRLSRAPDQFIHRSC